jgi:adenylate cyclase
MTDVFLSYSRSSLASARRISDLLEAAGYSVWFDEDLPAHRPYSDVIEEQLEKARAVVVLWSREGAQSQWVRSEANRARETGRLVQIRLDDARLPMPFDQIQCADLRGWRGKNSSAAWGSVLSGIAALTNDEGRTEKGAAIELRSSKVVAGRRGGCGPCRRGCRHLAGTEAIHVP